jgi:hypothetical protein
MRITIAGHDDARCRRLETLTREVAAELHVEAHVELTDIETMPGLLDSETPALMVDGAVKASGRIPTRNEIGSWLSPHLP